MGDGVKTIGKFNVEIYRCPFRCIIAISSYRRMPWGRWWRHIVVIINRIVLGDLEIFFYILQIVKLC